MVVPPGVIFLFDLSKSFVPPLALHVSLRLLSDVFSWTLPTSTFVAVWVFTLPVYIQARATYTHFMQSREARRLGAELVPQIKGKWPGNLDLLLRSLRRKTVYIGEELERNVKQHGTTFGVSIMGDVRITTIHPENIKRILATEFDNYVKGKAFNSYVVYCVHVRRSVLFVPISYTKSMLGVGVFNSDGEMWQFHRKSESCITATTTFGLTDGSATVTRPLFGKERITDFETFDTKAQIAMRRMQETFDQDIPIDFQVRLIHCKKRGTRADTEIFRTSAVGSPSILPVNSSWAPRSTV